MPGAKKCAYCGKELSGITPVVLTRKSRFSFLRFEVAEFCSQECENKYLKRKEEMALSKEAVSLAEELNEIAVELQSISERLYNYSSLPQDQKDPSQLAEIKGALASLGRPDLSRLKAVAEQLREETPDDPKVEQAASELESINTSYSIPGWSEDLNGLAGLCDSAASNLISIANKIDSVNIPKE